LSNLEREYRSLLRWYPAAWRQQNEEVILGTLLDAARAQGLTSPSDADRHSLQLAGLRQWAIGSGQRSLVGTVALATGVAFFVFYCTFTSRDPAHSYDGYVGPFTNPSFMIGVLLALALVLAVRRVTFAARFVAVLSVAASIVIGFLSWRLGWPGPSLTGVTLFAAFGACGLSRSNRISRGLLLITASLCAVIAAFSLETMTLQSTYALSPFWQMETTIAIVAVLAAILLAWPWKRHSRNLGAQRRRQTAD
jgi:hypothetical protein